MFGPTFLIKLNVVVGLQIEPEVSNVALLLASLSLLFGIGLIQLIIRVPEGGGLEAGGEEDQQQEVASGEGEQGEQGEQGESGLSLG